MNVLILGSGGREHALAWKVAQSPLLKNLFIAPGNAGTHAVGTNIELNPLDFQKVLGLIDEKEIDLVIIGPEDPLVRGVTDFLLEHRPSLAVLGPSAAGAQLEGSKDFAKEFMKRNHIPTATHQTFRRGELDQALSFLSMVGPPYVIKVDGLAAGKGVLICNTKSEAEDSLRNIFEGGQFGTAADKVLIEEFLQGIEMSAFVLTDGQEYLMLPSAKDYKRIGEGDTGLNTGGMGSISPVPFADSDFMRKVEDRIIKPTMKGIQEENLNYRGFIFFGLMNVAGNPYVIEYNVRLGDPETESILPRIDSDLLHLAYLAARGELKGQSININPNYSTTVMVVSGGYPEGYAKGHTVMGLESVSALCTVFHAGTKMNEEDRVITNGGRVLGVNALGDTLEQSVTAAYNGVYCIQFENAYYRRDLGKDLM